MRLWPVIPAIFAALAVWSLAQEPTGQEPAAQTTAIPSIEANKPPENIAATSASLRGPQGPAVDQAGNLFFADQADVLRMDAKTGILTLVAGTGTPGFSGDGGAAPSAQLDYPTGVAVDSAGDVYIADNSNNRIRKVTNGKIATVAGTGMFGFSGDNGPAGRAQLNEPESVAVDSAGNLYIADAANSRVRKVSKGVISTVAGMGMPGFSGDNGPATAAELNIPRGVAVDAAGNLYIADSANSRIRKVSGGVITTVAGNGNTGFGGDNGPATSAQLNSPRGVAVDAAGNLYIADSGNNRIRKVSGGVITTVAGNGNAGFAGDNSPATSAQLTDPLALAVDASGAFYIADMLDSRVRKVANGIMTTVAGNGTAGIGALSTVMPH